MWAPPFFPACSTFSALSPHIASRVCFRNSNKWTNHLIAAEPKLSPIPLRRESLISACQISSEKERDTCANVALRRTQRIMACVTQDVSSRSVALCCFYVGEPYSHIFYHSRIHANGHFHKSVSASEEAFSEERTYRHQLLMKLALGAEDLRAPSLCDLLRRVCARASFAWPSTSKQSPETRDTQLAPRAAEKLCAVPWSSCVWAQKR